MTDDLEARIAQIQKDLAAAYKSRELAKQLYVAQNEREIDLCARLRVLEGCLADALEYLESEADVVDGDDGQPEANRAMSLATSIQVRLGKYP